MFKVMVAVAALFCSLPAWAAEREFDLGWAYPGMMQGQFRFGAWPPGMAIRCSDDPDLPKDLGQLLYMPKPMMDLGATRCALLAVDDKGVWKPAQRKIAGIPLEMSATFAPDMQDTRRLVQLFITGPREAYAGLVRHFVARFGPPTNENERLVHWQNARNEALVMHEEGETVLGMLIDTKLQEAMNQKLEAARKRK
ncbi:MAG: hypothetical protein AB7G62_05835 [Magnetospirillum sp.]